MSNWRIAWALCIGHGIGSLVLLVFGAFDVGFFVGTVMGTLAMAFMGEAT